MPRWNAGGVQLPHGPYMIGAGVCKTPARTADWLKVAPVVSGSYTPEQRNGNSGNLMWPMTIDELLTIIFYGLNGYGMPNMGFASAIKELARVHSEQPIIVSVAGFSVDDYIAGYNEFSNLRHIAAIELNLGCPNTQGDHPDITSFNLEAVRKILETLSAFQGKRHKPIWLKFSPYSNPAELKRMAELVNGFKDALRLAVVTCNTFPNAYAGDGLIDPNNGMAGLSGPAMKPIARGQVKQFRQYLDERIDVIGVGGITTGDDIVDFLEAGASAVQITSLAHWAGDPRSFTDRFFKEGTSDRFFKLMESETGRSYT